MISSVKAPASKDSTQQQSPVAEPVVANTSAVHENVAAHQTGAIGSSKVANEAAPVQVNPNAGVRSAARVRQLGQGLKTERSSKTGHCQMSWRVDARKLRGNIKQMVSPTFDVPLANGATGFPFKMTLYPRGYGDCKGGTSFEKSHGRGSVQVKCESQLPPELVQLGFTLTVGNGNRKKSTRGPVWHDFSESAVAALPKGQDEWDFYDVIDRQSETFVVTLEMIPPAKAPGGATFGGA